MADELMLTELQPIVLEVEQMGLPLRDAMRLATQRAGFFIGQQRYSEELAKALKTLEGNPNAITGPETARAATGATPGALGSRGIVRSATHQIGSTGG